MAGIVRSVQLEPPSWREHADHIARGAWMALHDVQVAIVVEVGQHDVVRGGRVNLVARPRVDLGVALRPRVREPDAVRQNHVEGAASVDIADRNARRRARNPVSADREWRVQIGFSYQTSGPLRPQTTRSGLLSPLRSPIAFIHGSPGGDASTILSSNEAPHMAGEAEGNRGDRDPDAEPAGPF